MAKKIPKRFPMVILDQVNNVADRMYDPQVHVVFTFADRINERRIGQAIRRLMDIEPVLGCRMIDHPRRPFWQRREDLDSLALAPVIETQDPGQALQGFIAQELNPGVDPLVSAVIYRNGYDTLVLKISHLIADGGGVKDIIHLLSGIHQQVGRETEAYPALNYRGDRSLRQALRWTDVKTIRRRLRQNPEPTPTIGLTYREPDRQIKRLTTRVIAPDVFRALKRWAQERGATVNDLLLAAFYQAFFNVIQPDPGLLIGVKVPCDLRPLTKHKRAGAVCNLSSQYLPMLRRVDCQDFKETMRQVQTVMRKFKAEGPAIGPGALVDRTFLQPPYSVIKGFMDEEYNRMNQTGWALPAFTNIGVLDAERLRFGEAPVTNAYIASPVAVPPTFIVGASCFQETLTLTSGYCMEKAGGSAVETFMDEMMGELRRIVNN